MARYLFTYLGGTMGETEEEMQKSMEEWMHWFGSLGGAVLDMGAPLGASSSIGVDGSVREGTTSMLGGYSVIDAESLDDALDKAKGCPILSNGGSIEVYETLPVG